jgi:sulfur transfer complex TusBCD TusB component (DsrH family)
MSNNKNKTLPKFAQEIQRGVHLAFKKMLIQKVKTGDKVVLMQDGKIVHLNPEDVLLNSSF